MGLEPETVIHSSGSLHIRPCYNVTTLGLQDIPKRFNKFCVGGSLHGVEHVNPEPQLTEQPEVIWRKEQVNGCARVALSRAGKNMRFFQKNAMQKAKK